MKISHYKIFHFKGETYDWLSIFPFIFVRHKYWYFYEIWFGWLSKEWHIEIINTKANMEE